MHDKAHRETEEVKHLPHPLAVALGQILVDRDHVYALTAQRVEVSGQDDRLGLTFARLHFGDAALMQHDTAQDLHRKVRCSQYAVGRFAADGEGFRQKIIQRHAGGNLVFKPCGLPPQLLVAHRFVFVGQRQRFVAKRADPLDLAGAVIAEQIAEKSHNGTLLPS